MKASTFKSLLLLGCCSLLWAFSPFFGNQSVVQKDELLSFLSKRTFVEQSGLKPVEQNIGFWQKKLRQDRESMTYRSKLAGAYLKRFKLTKNIKDLIRADSLLSTVLDQPGGKTAQNLQAMGHVSIAGHQFAEAQRYVRKALQIGDEKTTSHLMLFDILMERGDYSIAQKHLERITNQTTFSYLIRESKMLDHNGDLEGAIERMEQASSRIAHNQPLSNWTKSNLADMYMHNRQLEKAYDLYLEVLSSKQVGSAYLHSLKSIAWIAYSYDGDAETALEILQFVDGQIKSPGVYPTMIQIAESLGKQQLADRYLETFFTQAMKQKYQGMYDTQLVQLSADHQYKTELSRKLILRELKNRPNPVNHGLHAFLLLQLNQKEKALQIAKNHVANRTPEPVPKFQLAEIYYANGMRDKALRLYHDLAESKTELGPATADKIEDRIEELDQSFPGFTWLNLSS